MLHVADANTRSVRGGAIDPRGARPVDRDVAQSRQPSEHAGANVDLQAHEQGDRVGQLVEGLWELLVGAPIDRVPERVFDPRDGPRGQGGDAEGDRSRLGST